MPRLVAPAEDERRKRLVGMWRRSGASAPEFAKRHGVSAWQLYAWAKRAGGDGTPEPQRRARSPRKSRRRSRHAGIDILPVRLLADQVRSPVPDAAVVEVQFRGGEVVRVLGEVPVERVRAVVTAVLAAC